MNKYYICRNIINIYKYGIFIKIRTDFTLGNDNGMRKGLSLFLINIFLIKYRNFVQKFILI